jgi:hypothetical protein
MLDQVRYNQRDGQSVDIAIVRQRFLRPLSMPGVGPDRASGIWNDAVFRGSVCAADYREAVRYRNRRG